LLISNFMAMKPSLPFNRVSIVCNVSKATKILSVMSLPGMNALCSYEMLWGNTCFNRLAMSFEIIL